MEIEYRGKRDRWSPEVIEQLKALWRAGKSAGQIADVLPGGFTRNSVIGKARRLGLDGRQSPIIRTPGPAQPLTPAQRMRKTRAARQAALAAQKAAAEIAPEPGPVWNIEPARREAAPLPGVLVTLMMLTDRICKWPIGDPRDEAFHFCGHASVVDSSYCREHHTRSRQPMSHFRERVA